MIVSKVGSVAGPRQDSGVRRAGVEAAEQSGRGWAILAAARDLFVRGRVRRARRCQAVAPRAGGLGRHRLRQRRPQAAAAARRRTTWRWPRDRSRCRYSQRDFVRAVAGGRRASRRRSRSTPRRWPGSCRGPCRSWTRCARPAPRTRTCATCTGSCPSARAANMRPAGRTSCGRPARCATTSTDDEVADAGRGRSTARSTSGLLVAVCAAGPPREYAALVADVLLFAR